MQTYIILGVIIGVVLFIASKFLGRGRENKSTCPACGKPYGGKPGKCPHCGEKLRWKNT